MAVVEAGAAAVRIKTGSWGVQAVRARHDTWYTMGCGDSSNDLQMQLPVVGHDAVRSPMSTADMLGLGSTLFSRLR